MGPRAARVVVATPRQAEILDRLDALARPASVTELAASGEHTNTVREHLDALVHLGLVERSLRPTGGRGRPAYGYAVASTSTQTDAYAVLVGALVRHLRASTPDPSEVVEALGRSYGRDLGSRVAPSEQSSNAARGVRRVATARLVQAMDRLGFSPEAGKAGTVRLRTCPLLPSAAGQEDVVCGFHRGVAQGISEQSGIAPQNVTLHPFAQPGACLLVISPFATGVNDTAG